MEATEGDFILRIRDVSKRFPGVTALDRVSIDVRRGEIRGIVGENGAGKSTLMKILSGVHRRDSGTIEFNGETVGSTTPIQSMKRGLSIIYQELNLVGTMTVGENIFLGRFGEVGGMRGTHERAKELLGKIGSAIDTFTLVSELGVSDRQMVEIAKALSFDSKLIIMDEPTSSLTAEEIGKLANIIRDLKERGISVIYISHKLEEILGFCDAVTVMRDGRVIGTRPIGEIDKNEMIAMMVGRTIENEYPERRGRVGAPLLEVGSLNTRKLHDVSFTLKKGEILGLVGLVGAGRSEIARAVFGADRARGHEVRIEGRRVTIRNPREAKNAGMALVPEDRKLQGLVLAFSVESNLSMSVMDRLTRFGFVGRAAEAEAARRQVKSLGVKTPSVKTEIRLLSGGNQQKCIVGRWLETLPRILILDEPTKGIDVGAKYEIYLLMRQIVENGGSIILISSELPEVLNMSDRVLTICDGRITGEFDPATTSAHLILERAMGITERAGGDE